jgi:ABC-2 type transport system ATP-binding protein
MTIIVSSHILAELEDYSTHMLIIRDGRIVEFTPIGHGAQHQGRLRLRVRLAAEDAKLATVLQQIPDVTVTESDALTAVIDTSDEPTHRAAVLKRLLAADLAVSEFAPERLGLQDAYLTHVQAPTVQAPAVTVPAIASTPMEGK